MDQIINGCCKTVSSPLGEAASQETMGQLAARLTHDLNNQMQAVSGYLELAILRTDNPQVRGYLSHAHDAAMNGIKVSSQLGAISRIAGEGQGPKVIGPQRKFTAAG